MSQEEASVRLGNTAKLVAYMRTFTDIPYAREIAAASGAEKAFQALPSEGSLQLTPLFEARYKATDRIIARHRMTQVLEIAAGLTPRGLAMTENPDVVYVATDLPEILEQERAIAESIIAALKVKRPNLHFRITNAFDRDSLLLAAAPFQPGRPVAVIAEGLLIYLTREEKETVAGNIHDLLERHGGIWINPDVETGQTWKHILSQTGYGAKMRQSAHSASDWAQRDRKDMFEDENAMRQFFYKAGFAIEEYQHSNVLQELSSPDLLNLNREEREELLEVLQFQKTWILTICQ